MAVSVPLLISVVGTLLVGWGALRCYVLQGISLGWVRRVAALIKHSLLTRHSSVCVADLASVKADTTFRIPDSVSCNCSDDLLY